MPSAACQGTGESRLPTVNQHGPDQRDADIGSGPRRPEAAEVAENDQRKAAEDQEGGELRITAREFGQGDDTWDDQRGSSPHV